jgi:hypothetical protein
MVTERTGEVKPERLSRCSCVGYSAARRMIHADGYVIVVRHGATNGSYTLVGRVPIDQWTMATQ